MIRLSVRAACSNVHAVNVSLAFAYHSSTICRVMRSSGVSPNVSLSRRSTIPLHRWTGRIACCRPVCGICRSSPGVFPECGHGVCASLRWMNPLPDAFVVECDEVALLVEPPVGLRLVFQAEVPSDLLGGSSGLTYRAWKLVGLPSASLRTITDCVCSIESGPCERVDVFHVSGRFWSTSACGEKRTPARPAWTSFPS